MSTPRLVRGLVAAMVFAASALLTPFALAETITQPDLKFSFVAPERFERVEPTNATGLYLFRSTLPDGTPMLVTLDKMGELLQEEPPGTTFKNRLSVLRFRLRQAMG
jgi:hypothetical protein